VHSVVVHDETTSPDPEVRRFRVAGEEPVLDDDDSWVLQSSRHTASVILQQALLPLRPDGQPVRRDQVA
jgi:hypothetical protein